jgi:DNA polymerase III subunit epsilon
MELLIVILLLSLGIGYFIHRHKANEQGMDNSNSFGTPVNQLSEVLPERFVVFDLETTGLYADQHEILEIGAIRVNRDSDHHETFQTLVTTKKPVPDFIKELTGITQEQVNTEGIPLADAMRDFKDFIGDLPLVAYNAKFDMSFLRAASDEIGIKIPNKVSCALIEARKAWPNRRSYKLVDLAKDGRISGSGAHRALEDARIAMIVYISAKRIS